MEVVILIIILILITLIFKRVETTVLFLGVIDITLRIISFIGNNSFMKLNEILNKYIPSSIPNIIYKYSTGLLSTILIWLYVLMMIAFVYYVLKIVFKRAR